MAFLLVSNTWSLCTESLKMNTVGHGESGEGYDIKHVLTMAH